MDAVIILCNLENSINIIHTEGTKLRSRNGTVYKSKCKKHTKVNFKEAFSERVRPNVRNK